MTQQSSTLDDLEGSLLCYMPFTQYCG